MSRKKLNIAVIVAHCKKIATNYMDLWEPIDPSWNTKEGCAYIRLSTDEQTEEGHSLETQVHIAVAEARTRSRQDRVNYKITQFYIEPGVSGQTQNRTELQSMMREIRKQRYKFVVMKELSRLTRDANFWNDFFQLCRDNRCKIIIKNLPVDIDPNNPSSIMILRMLAAVAEYEAQITAGRISESVYSSLVNAGKFNSTHRRLGLEKLVVNGVPKPGFYQQVPNEIGTVQYIFRTFCKYGSHSKTLETLEQKQIKNWNGKQFDRHSLINLLTDTRYISKWRVNLKNKDSDESELRSHEKYALVDLPHEPIIDEQLWNQTSAVLKKVSGNLGKATRVKRIYPLASILKYQDGSSFSGEPGKGRTQTSLYYKNKANKIRIRADILEEAAEAELANLIGKTPKLQQAIIKASNGVQDASQRIKNQLLDLNQQLAFKEDESNGLMKNLSFMIKDSLDDEQAADVRKHFRQSLNENRQAQSQLRDQIKTLTETSDLLVKNTFCWSAISLQAQSVLQTIRENDPLALKKSYFDLFEKIVVSAEDSEGKRTLTFIIRDGGGAFEDVLRNKVKMVEAEQG